MVIKSDKHKIQQLLSEAITVLCKNGLNFKSHVNVEALIGITLDDDEVLLVSVRETIPNQQAQKVLAASAFESSHPKALPSRKRPAQHISVPANSDIIETDSGEPPSKRLDEEEDDEVIQIKGEEISDDDIDAEHTHSEPDEQNAEVPDDSSANNYDASQLEQFVDFATTAQATDLEEADSKAALFTNPGVLPQGDLPFPSSLASQTQHPASRGPQVGTLVCWTQFTDTRAWVVVFGRPALLWCNIQVVLEL